MSLKWYSQVFLFDQRNQQKVIAIINMVLLRLSSFGLGTLLC